MKWIKFITGSVLVLILVSCANRSAGPTGGPKDSIPPVVVRSVPLNGALNYKKKEILVYFDENVTLDKVNENFILSPPQKTQPVLRANGKVLSVILEDELIDSTTYSLFFGNAIVDLNEKNPLTNYQFAFSTGNEIDTLQASGRLYDAWTLDPVSSVFVGLHPANNDSALLKDPFVRVTKSDEEGRFTIRNIKADTYSVFALADANRDLIYQPGEAVAFYAHPVSPRVSVSERADTVWTDSVTIDTVRLSRVVNYSPDTLKLHLFKESLKRQYLVKSERKDQHYFSVFFNRSSDSLPVITPLNFEPSTRFLMQKNATLDSLTYWIPDSTIFQQDTLQLAIRYQKTDSVYALYSQLDTLNLVFRKPVVAKSATKGARVQHRQELNVSTNLSASFDLNASIRIKLNQPVSSVDTSLVRLSMKKDSLFVPVTVSWQPLDSVGLEFQFVNTWKEGESYELKVDSAAFKSIYGSVNNSLKTSFKMKTPEDYSTLRMKIVPFDSLVVVQVIDGKEALVQQQAAGLGGNKFEYLKPGDYFVKLFVDANGNGKWDTGELQQKKFPEQVYYYSKKLTLKANWELEEQWDYKATTNPYAKPEDLVKKKKQKAE